MSAIQQRIAGKPTKIVRLPKCEGPSFYNTGRTFDVRRFLRWDRNDIVIIAFNFGGPRSVANLAGVAARLDIQLSSLR